MIDFLLPRTDAGVGWQAAIAVTVFAIALYLVRRDREFRLLVFGLALLTGSWFALRTLH